MATLPDYLFLACAEYDVTRLTRDGLSAVQGLVTLYESVEEAEAALEPERVRCLLMIHAGRMGGDGYTFDEISAGIWETSTVPPAYLWISERDTQG